MHNLVIDRIALSINPMLLALALEVFKDAKPSTPEERAILKKIVGHVTSARSSAGLIFCRCRKGSWVECCCRVDRGSHCTCCAVAQERNQPPGAACFCSSETKDEPPA
ncbi:MAG: hypothetical protein A2W26_07430 [Acidobacteria bacterium RBG_16_64_8]|nr:MAG: hypothetical protein A2W26_07430 [Acidobacteria bacterium RBG_16_64_8]